MRLSVSTVAFSLLLSVSLWLYISLQADYQMTVPVRVDWQLPADRSLESPLPSQLYVKLAGSGWNLLNALYFDRSMRVEIKLSPQSQARTITEAELRAGFRSSVPLRVLSIEPTVISYQLGIIAQKKVPVVANVQLTPANGYVLARPLVVVPDSALLIGSTSVLDTLKQWPTEPFVRSNLQATIVELVPLVQSPIVRVLPERVLVKGIVQQLAEITYEDVPVIAEQPLDASEQLLPPIVRVTLRGGLADIQTLLDRAEVPVSVSVSAAQLRQQGELVQPTVHAPAWVVEAICEPRWLVYRRLMSDGSLLKQR